ncbi:carbohydrate ABC transporter permease [Paenibacillus contaminans]|uniref:Carbohydrate ABC transporter permease n=1 Tax=Paenibacillus contaminans TaxID=450362 RepID=A0A329MN24_9BACL|nr:carbohydrate ABC transporter permease [Paenibacillus contaminans]RAV21275.1 carbohydrate ABC transporter permease [Paenibacillus contaminans]
MKLRRGKWFDRLNMAGMLVLCFLCLYPFYQLVVLSFNDGTDAIRGGIYFWPREWTLDNYATVFSNPLLGKAYLVTAARTVIGTLTSVIATGMLAYALSKNDLLFHKWYVYLLVFTMFFSGGLVPTFLLIKSIGLLNNFLVYIIPMLISVWNAMIMIGFFRSMPDALEESAKIDGYNEIGIFFRIVIPTSMPVFAAIALFNGVSHWNAWFDAYIYMNNPDLQPLQTILVKIIKETAAQQTLNDLLARDGIQATAVTPEAVKIATMMVAIGPILLIYPLLQKYFIKGIMLGSLKG